MAATPREQLHAMIDELPDDELERVRNQLGRLRADNEREALDTLRQKLLDQGFLSRMAPPPTAEVIREYHARTPIDVEGESLSATIIDDRGPAD